MWLMIGQEVPEIPNTTAVLGLLQGFMVWRLEFRVYGLRVCVSFKV